MSPAGPYRDPGETLLPLSEVFGPTIQGEGPHAGRRVGFVRLGLCNLACEWCDTPYTWDTSRFDVKAECPDTPVRAIAEQVHALGVSTMVLSGGEPLMHRAKLLDLFAEAPLWEWHVETNGTIPPPDWWYDVVAHTTVSPKVSTSDPVRKRFKPAALSGWAELARANRAAFKFVLTDPSDLDVVLELVADYDIPRHAVWLMPEGTTPEALAASSGWVAELAIAAGFNVSTRLHVLLWGDRRGV